MYAGSSNQKTAGKKVSTHLFTSLRWNYVGFYSMISPLIEK